MHRCSHSHLQALNNTSEIEITMDAVGSAVCIPIPMVVSVPDPITSEEEEASVRQKRLNCCDSKSRPKATLRLHAAT